MSNEIIQSEFENDPFSGRPQEINSTMETENKIELLGGILDERREQAKRSIIVQVVGRNSYKELYQYCRQFGNVTAVYPSEKKGTNFVLLEMETRNDFASVISANSSITTLHRFFIFDEKNKPQKNYCDLHEEDYKVIFNENRPIDVKEIFNASRSISEQINLLYDSFKISDLSMRLRFLTALKVESILSNLLPNNRVLLFGSSVNGFGNCNSDADIQIFPDGINTDLKEQNRLSPLSRASLTDRLVLQYVADELENSGCKIIGRILAARVPIIKYEQSIVGLEVDLSIAGNETSYALAEILYLYGGMDPRIRPLIFLIRLWAMSVGISSSSTPSPFLKNLHVTLLVLFFLQQPIDGIPPILPSIKDLYGVTNTDSIKPNLKPRIFFNNENYHMSLEHLLIHFLRFYQNFDFTSHGINLFTGELASPLHLSPSALYILNPLDETHNTSDKIKEKSIYIMKKEMGLALRILEDPKPNKILSICRLQTIDRKQKRKESHIDLKHIFEL